MRKTGTLLITAAISALMAACGGTVENKPANTANTNTNTATPAGPTVEALRALETKAFEAYKNKDSKFFEGFLDAKFVMYDGGKKIDKAATVKLMGEHKDEIKSFAFSDEKVTKIGADAAVYTAKAVVDGTSAGKKTPEVTSSTLYIRQGTEWRAAWHAEVPIVVPAAATDRKTAAKLDQTGSSAAKHDPAIPEDKPKADDKKPADDKAKTDDKKADAPAADPATDALFALEKSGWEAWKAKDWAKLGGMMMNDVLFVNPMGGVTVGKEANIKGWTDQNCDVKSVSLSDASSVSVDGSTSLLVAKGSPTGTCGTEKLAPVWAYAIYVKEGADWKLAYHLEHPAK